MGLDPTRAGCWRCGIALFRIGVKSRLKDVSKRKIWIADVII